MIQKKGKATLMIWFFCVLLCGVTITSSTTVQSIEDNTRVPIDSLSDSDVIIIPDDYPTIQEGIDNANPGDTIFVKSGIYTENIVIDKERLYVKGENKYDTVIDMQNSSSDAVMIKADGVTLQGFTIAHARNKDAVIWNQSGIVIFTSNVTVKDTIISQNRLGILSYTTAWNLTICDNMFLYDGFFPGCYLLNIDGQYQGTDTIPLESISLHVWNNTINGKPLYYIENMHDTIIEEDVGQVVLINCTNITIRNVVFSKNDFSVLLYYCKNCVVENITILDSDGELILFFSENTTIQNSRITNSYLGICFDLGAKNNTARYNEIVDNLQAISVLTSCSGNRIYGNRIHHNNYGLMITSYTENAPAHDNDVYENEFISNRFGIILFTAFQNLLCYTYNNTISNNTFRRNTIGIELRSSEGNVMKGNVFQKNVISALFFDCTQNYWNGNYWNHPRVFPKPILGFLKVTTIPRLTLNFDRHPAGFR